MLKNRLIVVRLDTRMLYAGVVVICLAMGVWLYNTPAVWTMPPLSALISGKRVVVDPGHGGYDPGAQTDSGLLEKEINLDVALRLKKHLSRVGIYTELIREDDRDYAEVTDCITRKERDLTYRLKLIHQSKAHLLLSIHANMFTDPVYKGSQTFFKPGDAASKQLATLIQDHLVKALGPNRRKPKPGDFRILQDVKIPAVIVETGFLSNQEEAQLLATPDYREKIAAAICQGVIGYFCGLSVSGAECP
ncbi:MAG TPA: N-acetylmuramoyl-L-alanine amidase [Bacillota bacterium]|nr:N-acetylmuramoyl-L-alanine amidase [Bacillota bacterium]